jgi:hypothetical protein
MRTESVVLAAVKKVAAVAVACTATLVAASAVASAAPATMKYECFGYTGTFIAHTRITKADWNDDGNPDECFGIAPNRHIYHSWPGHPWVEMPNNGLADNTSGWDHLYGGGREIIVLVQGKGKYCSDWLPGDGWHSWFNCVR